MRPLVRLAAVAALLAVGLATPASACYPSAPSAPTPPYRCHTGWCMERWNTADELAECIRG